MEPTGVGMRPISMDTDRSIASAPQSDRIRMVPAPAYEPVGGPSRAGAAVLARPVPARVPRRSAAEPGTQARRAAIAMVTALFEVIDRRRPASHLSGVVSARLLDHVELLVSADLPRTDSDGAGECAKVRRVHIQMSGSAAAEIFGSYSRGRRVRAFAGRIELLPCRVRAATPSGSRGSPPRLEYRWRLVAFSLT